MSSTSLREEIHKFMVTHGVEDFYCVAKDPDDEQVMLTARSGNCIWWAGALVIELDDVKTLCNSGLIVGEGEGGEC